MFEDGAFSFCISASDVVEGYKKQCSFGKYNFYTDDSTPCAFFSSTVRECIIFGYAVDVFNGESDNLANKILESTSEINDVIEYERKLGGKYVILYRDSEGYYIIGDATCSIPVYYLCEASHDIVCSDNPKVISRMLQLTPNPALEKIRKSGDVSQAMPYDITEYSEIKQLLPNHYLNCDERKAVRFVNSKEKQSAVSVNDATDIVLPMIERIVGLYNERFDLHCPITSGRDSRVVLAFLSSINSQIAAYTMNHGKTKADLQELSIPMRLTQEISVCYDQINDSEVTCEDIKEADEILGCERYSKRTLMIAKTVKNHCNGRAIVNGDIIGQVGKCSLHRDIRNIFATPRYFRCKLHNYSSEALTELKKWIEEINESGEKTNLFDLFSVENRLGRWAGQENLIYNSVGQIYLNIFNSRSIIYIWSAVPRKLRKKSLLHIDLISEKQPSLLNVPFEKDESLFVKISKSTATLYLLSSYAKHYMERMKFYRRNKK